MDAVLAADPAYGGAVKGGAGPDVCLQGGEGLRLLGGQSDLRSLEGQQPVALFKSPIGQRRPGWEETGEEGPIRTAQAKTTL